MQPLETGIVIFFDTSKKAGLIAVCDQDGNDTNEHVIFRLNDVQWVEVVAGDVTFTGPQVSSNGPSLDSYAPSAGSAIAFQRVPTNRERDRAAPWTYLAQYQKCLRNCDTQYRVRQVTSDISRFTSTPLSQKVVWEGKIQELYDIYGVGRLADGSIDDPLGWEIGREDIAITYLIERWVEGEFLDDGQDTAVPGDWELCDYDPRPFPRDFKRTA